MKILLIDDHDMFRDGICLFFGKEYPELEVLQAKTHQEALQQLQANHQDLKLILLDLHLQDSTPHENIKKIKTAYPDIPITVISGEERPEFIANILEYGVYGYIPKSVGNDEFINALKRVLSGKKYLPDNIAAIIERNKNEGLPSLNQLTQRQKQVLALLAQGLHNQQIADKLHIAENTVNVHVKTILKTLQAGNRTEAGFLARKYGLV